MANPQGQDAQGQPLEFKSQPWVLFDSIVATSFLMGSPVLAIGATTPAISSSGEMLFFNSPGRTRANMPWYTNLDTPGILSYGLEVWQLYLSFEFPAFTPTQNVGFDLSLNPGVPGTVKLMEAILNFGALDMTLGQENQTVWPLSRFGAGGGLHVNAGTVTTVAQNSQQQSMNVMKLPEPIEMPRTMNIDAKIRIAPEAFNLIGSPVAPGVGSPLAAYQYGILTAETPVVVPLAQLPFKVQLGLVGRRVKKTQYGQLPA